MKLTQVFAEEFRDFKHRNLCFVTENNFQFSISVYVTSVFSVLQFVGFDISPDFFNCFCTGSALAPTTAANAALGVRAFMKAAFGLRADFFLAGFAGLAAFFTAGFLAAAFFAAGFFAAGFLAAGFFAAGFFTAFLAFDPAVAVVLEIDFQYPFN